MDNQLTEPEIVRGLQDGRPDAWAALCELYSVRLWRYVARLIGSDESVVADVFQETMLAVAGAGRSLRNETRIWAWLAGIAHNQAALFWRKHYRENSFRGGDVSEANAEVIDNPEALLAQREQNELVRRLLSEMATRDAAVLVAKYLEGLSVQEIVGLHGGTTEGVRSRLARARRDFRERFEQASAENDHRMTTNPSLPNPYRAR